MKTVNILLILLLLSACKKEEDKITTIEGILMASCDTPAANKNGFIITEDGLLSGPGISLNFTTNESGYFKVTYKGKKDVSSFMVRVQGSSDVLRVPGLPGHEKNLGKVYIFPPAGRYYVKLEVENNTYSELDTLYYHNGNFPLNSSSPWRKIAGPFSNSIIDTVHLFLHNSALPLTYGSNTLPKVGISYYLNEYDSWSEKEVFFSTIHCSDEFETVTLVID